MTTQFDSLSSLGAASATKLATKGRSYLKELTNNLNCYDLLGCISVGQNCEI